MKWEKVAIKSVCKGIYDGPHATLNLYAVIPDGFRGCLGRRMALIRVDEKKVYSLRV